MSHSGYVIDKSLKDGDLCFQGPLVIFTGKMTRNLFTGAIDKTCEVHPWHPALPNLAKWLANDSDALRVLSRMADCVADGRSTDRDLADAVIEAQGTIRMLVSAITEDV